MTRDEIIEMARQVEFNVGFKWCVNFIELEAFAKLVAEAEREACAKVCDELSKKHSWEGFYANECAEEIRARGEA